MSQSRINFFASSTSPGRRLSQRLRRSWDSGDRANERDRVLGTHTGYLAGNVQRSSSTLGGLAISGVARDLNLSAWQGLGPPADREVAKLASGCSNLYARIFVSAPRHPVQPPRRKRYGKGVVVREREPHVLPDYPRAKSLLRRFLLDVMRAASRRAMGIFAGAPRHRHFEGHTSNYERSDGSVHANTMHEAKSIITLTDAELPELELDAILERVRTAGSEIGAQMVRGVWQDISEAVAETGNRITASGLSAETILEMLRRTQFDFDADGNPELPSLTAHPDTLARVDLETEFARLDVGGDLHGEFEEVLAEKYLDWRAREADRKLVG